MDSSSFIYDAKKLIVQRLNGVSNIPIFIMFIIMSCAAKCVRKVIIVAYLRANNLHDVVRKHYAVY